MDKPNDVTTIKGLFGQTGRQFAVPNFQRAYSWEVKKGGDQAGQFLRDIREQPAERRWWIGHFLFEADGNRLFVIDGQQRLTTVVLFMGSLVAECGRRGIERLGDTEVQEIRETYLEHRVQKFHTVPEDATYFDSRVVGGDAGVRPTTGRRSERRLAEAMDFFAKELAEASSEELISWFAVVENAVATTYTMEGENAKEMATQVFAFQNDRGKPLTILEKTKAWLMNRVYRASGVNSAEDDICAVERNFAAVYSQTEAVEENEDTVLGWHCQAWLDANATGAAALEAIKKALEKETDKTGWIKRFTAGLAETFRFVADLEKVEERRGGLVADICFLGKTSAMPLLVKLGHYGRLKLSGGICEALEPIENILFKLSFTTGDYRVNELPQYAKEFDGNNYETTLLPRLREAAKNGFRWWWDFNGACRRWFTENRSHYVSRLKYVLYQYENHLRKDGKPVTPGLSIDECRAIFRENKREENTLDHIAPQNPDYTVYTDEFKRDCLSNIGNLSLLTWANNAGKSCNDPAAPAVRGRYDGPFLAQKEIFKVLEGGKWGEKEIEARRDRIVRFVIQHWHLDDSGSDGEK